MLIIICLLIFTAIFLVFNVISDQVITAGQKWQETHVAKVAGQLDDSFIFLERRNILLLTFAPLITAGLGFLLLPNLAGIFGGVAVGVILPVIFANIARQNRVRQFQGQLVDTLMIFSSSLKGGLSFIQALEIVCEEMPAPISQELGLVLKENRLGVALEESLSGLRKRMPLEEVNLLVSSILVAKETGGELTKVFSRLVETIRNNLKLKEKINTLTLQGRLQGIIMSSLPIIFAFFIYKQDPHHFDIMWESQLGKQLLIGAGIAQLIGMFWIKKISTMKV